VGQQTSSSSSSSSQPVGRKVNFCFSNLARMNFVVSPGYQLSQLLVMCRLAIRDRLSHLNPRACNISLILLALFALNWSVNHGISVYVLLVACRLGYCSVLFVLFWIFDSTSFFDCQAAQASNSVKYTGAKRAIGSSAQTSAQPRLEDEDVEMVRRQFNFVSNLPEGGFPLNSITSRAVWDQTDASANTADHDEHGVSWSSADLEAPAAVEVLHCLCSVTYRCCCRMNQQMTPTLNRPMARNPLMTSQKPQNHRLPQRSLKTMGTPRPSPSLRSDEVSWTSWRRSVTVDEILAAACVSFVLLSLHCPFIWLLHI